MRNGRIFHSDEYHYQSKGPGGEASGRGECRNVIFQGVYTLGKKKQKSPKDLIKIAKKSVSIDILSKNVKIFFKNFENLYIFRQNAQSFARGLLNFP